MVVRVADQFYMNMTYTILEDCSPFYIRFTFNGLDEIVKFALENQTNINVEESATFGGYFHKNLQKQFGSKIINMLPMSDTFNFFDNRVGIFETPSGGGSGIHKDGKDCRVSFNIPLEVHDDLCITSWYSDDAFKGEPLKGYPYSRSICSFETLDLALSTYNNPNPIKTMVAHANEMILFNTDILHCWDNRKSTNVRKVLTLRHLNESDMYFDDVKQFLFSS